MRIIASILGVALLLMTCLDLVWTAIGTHGGGPFSSRVTDWGWKAFLAMHRRRPNHRLLSFAGTLLLSLIVTLWILAVWVGWVLVFMSADVVHSETHEPADVPARIYYVGYTIFTMGNGDYVPRTPQWQILTPIASGTGLAVATLAITYILSVLAATVEKRALAAYLADLGATPERIIRRAWNGQDFKSFEQHLVQLASMVGLYSEQHLAYPVLHYFHGETRRATASLRIGALYEAVLLMSEGAAPEVQLDKMITEPVRDAIRGLARVVSGEFVSGSGETAPPAATQSPLIAAGVPLRNEGDFLRAVSEDATVRKRLVTIIEDDGWSWSDVANPEMQ